ncbi:hypothetical protein [Kitasatospora sp. NPDC004272]
MAGADYRQDGFAADWTGTRPPAAAGRVPRPAPAPAGPPKSVFGPSAGYLLQLRCSYCPGDPVIEVYRNVDARGSLGQTDTDRCIRCQGRLLAHPHPDDHLCATCRIECADCRAPITTGEQRRGGLCHRCRGECRTCGAPAANVLCTLCSTSTHTDPFAAVMHAFPDALIVLVSGRFTAQVMTVIREEIARVGHQRLGDRIQRRWWRYWAHLPLADNQPDVYTPDQCAINLVSPNGCSDDDCEDGWLVDADRVCPRCAPPAAVVDGPHQAIRDVLAEAGADALRADPRRARAAAEAIREQMRRAHGVSRNDRSPVRKKEKKEGVPEYRPAPFTRLREPADAWPPREPDGDDSVVLKTVESAREELPDSYEAALQRARRERAARGKRPRSS